MRNPLITPALLCLFVACSGEKSTTPESGEDVAESCAQYLSCVTVATPTAAASIREAYGPDSSCWDDASTAEMCAEECTNAIRAIHQLEPTEEACDDGSPLDSSVVLAGVSSLDLEIMGDDGDGGCDDRPYTSVEIEMDLTETDTFTSQISLLWYNSELHSEAEDEIWRDSPCTLNGLDIHCELPSFEDPDISEGSLDLTVGSDRISVSGRLTYTDHCVFEIES